jgi:hypothetical protein
MPRAIACRALHVDLVNIRRIAEHLLVIYSVEESRLAVGGKPRRTRPEHRADRAGGEADDLLLPFRLERNWANNQHAANIRRASSSQAAIRLYADREEASGATAELSRTSARKAVRVSSRTGPRAQSGGRRARHAMRK